MNVTSVVRGRWQFHQHLSHVSSDCHHHFKESLVFISQSLMTNWTRGHIAIGLRQPACRWTLGPRPAFKPCLRSDSAGTLVELHSCFLHIYDIMLTKSVWRTDWHMARQSTLCANSCYSWRLQKQTVMTHRLNISHTVLVGNSLLSIIRLSSHAQCKFCFCYALFLIVLPQRGTGGLLPS